MELIIQKFASYYQEIFGESNEKFLEDNGRCLFLLYIKPIINGAGNYYIEAKTRGYLISFNFNQNKQTGVKRIQIKDKTIFEAVV